jgi:hypothetical protein
LFALDSGSCAESFVCLVESRVNEAGTRTIHMESLDGTPDWPLEKGCQRAARGTNKQLVGLPLHDRLRLFIYNIWQTLEGKDCLMGGFLYFWRQYETSISGSTEKRIRCVGCSHVFEYEITREGFGRGDSPFNLSNAEAAANARKRAQADLSQALSEGIEPIHCTSCGIFQPDMVRLLRERHGKHLDPNKYASDRIITIPIEEAIKQALRAANAENTVKSYTKFLETWPYSFYGSWAKEK